MYSATVFSLAELLMKQSGRIYPYHLYSYLDENLYGKQEYMRSVVILAPVFFFFFISTIKARKNHLGYLLKM